MDWLLAEPSQLDWGLIGRTRIERRQQEWAVSHRHLEEQLQGISEHITLPEAVGQGCGRPNSIFTSSFICGSANMDIRSFLLNFEVNCVLHSGDLSRQLASLFEKWQDQSEKITRQHYTERNMLQRLAESTARLLSPLL